MDGPVASSRGPAAADSLWKKRKLSAAAEDTTADLPLQCEACGVSVTSQELMREHLQGRKHAAAIRLRAARAEGRYCEVCALEFTGETQLTEHLKGRKHREKATAAARPICPPAHSKSQVAGVAGAGSSSAPKAGQAASAQTMAAPAVSGSRGKRKAEAKPKTIGNTPC